MRTQERMAGRLLEPGMRAMSILPRVLLVSACTAVCAVSLATTAGAEITYQSSIGSSGSEAGAFERPAGVAINQSSGDVYVADRGNNRVEQFTEGGSFIRAWGYDVVSSGEDDKPRADEVDEIRIRASG